jgi:hypothetical protein
MQKVRQGSRIVLPEDRKANYSSKSGFGKAGQMNLRTIRRMKSRDIIGVTDIDLESV